MRPSGERVGDTAESVKLVSGMYSKRAVDETCRDQNTRPPAAAAITMAATPAAASHLLLGLTGAPGPCRLGRWAARKAVTSSRIDE
jgi:hypothetical protein